MSQDDDKTYHKEASARHYRNNKLKFRQRLRERRLELAKWFLELKRTLNCLRCGENHPACLDFHHRNRLDKHRVVGAMVSQACSKENILLEIAKCDPLCSNCHRKLHFEEDTHNRLALRREA